MFKIVGGKGFHIRFKNGWTVSVQFGCGNYGDNYHSLDYEMQRVNDTQSTTAEVWAWNDDNSRQTQKQYPENPLGYQTPEEVLRFINKVSKFKE